MGAWYAFPKTSLFGGSPRDREENPGAVSASEASTIWFLTLKYSTQHRRARQEHAPPIPLASIWPLRDHLELAPNKGLQHPSGDWSMVNPF